MNLSLVKKNIYIYLYRDIYLGLDLDLELKMVSEKCTLCFHFILKWIGCEPLAQPYFLEVKIQLIYLKTSSELSFLP